MIIFNAWLFEHAVCKTKTP